MASAVFSMAALMAYTSSSPHLWTATPRNLSTVSLLPSPFIEFTRVV